MTRILFFYYFRRLCGNATYYYVAVMWGFESPFAFRGGKYGDCYQLGIMCLMDLQIMLLFEVGVIRLCCCDWRRRKS